MGGDSFRFDADELRGAAHRAYVIDALARDFFARSPGALGVGVWSLLGTRSHRLDDARWVDVDSPQVARLRRCVLPERRGWLQLATCACRSHWIDAVCGNAQRKLMIVMDESVLPLPAESVMRLLDDISRRVPSGSELVMAFGAEAPLRRAGRAKVPALELCVLDPDGRESLVRYPRLRFVEPEAYSPERAEQRGLIDAAAHRDPATPALAHLRVA